MVTEIDFVLRLFKIQVIKIGSMGEKFIDIILSTQAIDLEGLGHRVIFLIQNFYLMRGDHRLLVTVSLCGILAKPDETAESLVNPSVA